MFGVLLILGIAGLMPSMEGKFFLFI